MLQNFLAIKKRFAKLSVTTELKFTQMKSNSIGKWLSMVMKCLQGGLAEKHFSNNVEDAQGASTPGRLLATIQSRHINKIPLSYFLLPN